MILLGAEVQVLQTGGFPLFHWKFQAKTRESQPKDRPEQAQRIPGKQNRAGHHSGNTPRGLLPGLTWQGTPLQRQCEHPARRRLPKKIRQGQHAHWQFLKRPSIGKADCIYRQQIDGKSAGVLYN
jgi:hypothetical protein